MILVPKRRKTLGHIKRGYPLLVANSLSACMKKFQTLPEERIKTLALSRLLKML